ncbi:hypothetical protein BJ170DRAFT_313364 [Xylariales sp. AK1849]|nr:hypothetical protein BJ170DRAFT_313364 [Xylariales sp. AK1849]
MHSLSIVLAVVPLVLAQTTATDGAIPVSQYLSDLYGSAIPAGATGAVATSLASAVYSYQMALTTDAAYVSAANDVYMAMATASNSDAIASSLDSEGALNGGYTTADWYKSGVPESAQKEIASVFSGFHAVETSVLGAAAVTGVSTTSTATKSGSTTVTSAPTTLTTTSSGTAASGSATSSTATGGVQGARATGGAVAGLAAVIAIGAAALA